MNQVVQTVRSWPAYHRRVVFTVALLWFALTLRALWAEPELCGMLCLDLHETFLLCFVFAFLLIFVLGSQWRFRRRWAVAARPSVLAYGGVMMVAVPLALLPGFTLGKLVQDSVFDIQEWHWDHAEWRRSQKYRSDQARQRAGRPPLPDEDP